MSNVEKYKRIMEEYRRGEYGDTHLSLHDILNRAGEQNLLQNMTVEELEEVKKESFGIQRMMFEKIMKKKCK